ncbi:MAG: bacterioferritin-associated ferredoxin [Pirellula sp.]
MEPDDELCLCFHITWRKVLNYMRVHRVRLPSQLSECGGAGTGCGWCRRQLERLTTLAADSPPSAAEIDAWIAENTPNKRQYAEGRQAYRQSSAASRSSVSPPPPSSASPSDDCGPQSDARNVESAPTDTTIDPDL